METLDAHLNEMTEIWPIASKYISVLHTKAQYENSIKTLDKLIDEVGSNESHPLASLMETLAILIENYEDRHYPEPDADPIDCLKYLMQEHNLKQTDLPEIGSQGVVSEILNRKRQLTIRQIRALSNRFGVSPAVFI